jgi:signal transduction histidine kinase
VADVGTTSEAMREIVLASQGDAPSDDLLAHICRVVSRSFEFERVAVVRYHERLGEVVPVALVGEPPGALPPPLPIHEAPALERALDAQQVVFVADAREEGALADRLIDAGGVTSMFCVPLSSSGRCLGFLVGDRRGARFELDTAALAALDVVGVVTATLLEKLLVAEEMQRLDSMKSEFIAIASHELRTPLTSVYGISITLDERGDTLSEAERRQLRRVLREQSERLRALVDQLLDLSRFDVAEVEISPTSTPLAAKLHEIVELLAPDRHVAIDVDPRLTGWVDPVALDRIVSNLLSNALRYGELPITITATAGDTHLRLTVEDRGQGVADDFVPRLFERFSRSESSTQGVAGSGLGLAIARAYARAHDGDLVYEQARPTGARFVVTLPTNPHALPEHSPAPQPRSVRPGAASPSALGPVIVTVSPPEAAHALRELLDDYHAVLVAPDRVEIKPIDRVRRGTVIYRVIQVAQTVADEYDDAVMYFVAEDGNLWRLPPPPI